MVKTENFEIKVYFILGEEKHTFEVYFNNDKIVEVSKHYLALEFVKELSFIEEDILLNVYDETYDISYSILNGEIVSEFTVPYYMESYLGRYIETLNGNFKGDLILGNEETISI